MDRCVAEAERVGAAGLWLGVWEHNPRAIRFYEKAGFHDVGSHHFQLGSDAQTDRLMVRPIIGP
jgi:ribosomal protein S18 acetylase RimI-like enzyme